MKKAELTGKRQCTLPAAVRPGSADTAAVTVRLKNQDIYGFVIAKGTFSYSTGAIGSILTLSLSGFQPFLLRLPSKIKIE